MSGKKDKKIRQEIRRAGSDIYDEIKRQVNALKIKHRARIAWRILWGKW